MTKDVSVGGEWIPATCSRADLSVLLGVSIRTIDNLIAKQIVVPADQRGMYQTLPSVVAYLEDLRSKAAGRSGDSQLAERRVRMLESQQEVVDLRKRRERIETEKLEGTVLSADEVAAGWSAILHRVKSDLLGLPSQLRAQIPHLGAHGQEMTKELVRDILKDMADDIESGAVLGASASDADE